MHSIITSQKLKIITFRNKGFVLDFKKKLAKPNNPEPQRVHWIWTFLIITISWQKENIHQWLLMTLLKQVCSGFWSVRPHIYLLYSENRWWGCKVQGFQLQLAGRFWDRHQLKTLPQEVNCRLLSLHTLGYSGKKTTYWPTDKNQKVMKLACLIISKTNLCDIGVFCFYRRSWKMQVRTQTSGLNTFQGLQPKELNLGTI